MKITESYAGVKLNAESEPLKLWEDIVQKIHHEQEYISDSEIPHMCKSLLVTKTHLSQMVENPYSTYNTAMAQQGWKRSSSFLCQWFCTCENNVTFE